LAVLVLFSPIILFSCWQLKIIYNAEIQFRLVLYSYLFNSIRMDARITDRIGGLIVIAIILPVVSIASLPNRSLLLFYCFPKDDNSYSASGSMRLEELTPDIFEACLW